MHVALPEFGFISKCDEFQHLLLLSVHEGLKKQNNE